MTGSRLECELIRHRQWLEEGQKVFLRVLRLLHLVRAVASFYRRKSLFKAGLEILRYASTTSSQLEIPRSIEMLSLPGWSHTFRKCDRACAPSYCCLLGCLAQNGRSHEVDFWLECL